MAEPYFNRLLLTLTAVFSLLASAVGAYSGLQAEKAKDEAKKIGDALEQSRLAKDYQIKVFEIVDKSLAAEGGVIMASAYVSSLDDARLQAAMGEAIRVVARSRQGAGKLTQEEAEALKLMTARTREVSLANYEVASSVTPAAKAAIHLANPLSERGVTEAQVNARPVNPVGWDIDVFWCAARGQPSQALARAVASDLAARADARTALSGQQLGRIRVRSLGRGAAGDLPTSTNEVRTDGGEEVLGDSLTALAGAHGAPFVRKTVGGGTTSKWYVSLFACGV